MTNTFAPKLINNFVWEQYKADFPTLAKSYKTTVPFFPFADNTGAESTWKNKPYVVYDVMSRFQMTPFYPQKREHLLYSIRGPVDKVLDFRSYVQELLDRGDDAARDVMGWAATNFPENNVFLHDLRVFQSEFSRDTTKRAAVSNSNFYVSELIVDYRFHLTSSLYA